MDGVTTPQKNNLVTQDSLEVNKPTNTELEAAPTDEANILVAISYEKSRALFMINQNSNFKKFDLPTSLSHPQLRKYSLACHRGSAHRTE
jgi:hypothetical protein